MLSCLRLGAIAGVSLAVLGQSSVAQDAGLPRWDEPSFKKMLSELLVDEITEDSGLVVVRASGPKADGRTGSDTVITCGRGGDNDFMGVADLKLKTDSRYWVPRGTCDALLAAARWRRDAQ